MKEYKEYTDRYGLISGVSKKLAKEQKLDDVMKALHTVAMRKKSDGKYEIFNFNTKKEEAEEVDNLRERFAEEGIVPLSVHCISK